MAFENDVEKNTQSYAFFSNFYFWYFAFVGVFFPYFSLFSVCQMTFHTERSFLIEEEICTRLDGCPIVMNIHSIITTPHTLQLLKFFKLYKFILKLQQKLKNENCLYF